MTRCPNCGHEVSDATQSCPNCGRPPAASVISAATSKKKRPMGVTVLAVLVFGVALWAILPAILLYEELTTNGQIPLVLIVFLGLPAIGVGTGLWRLRPWARLGMIIGGGLPVVFLSIGLAILLIEGRTDDLPIVFIALMVFGLPWVWLLSYFFNPKVKAAFGLGVKQPSDPG